MSSVSPPALPTETILVVDDQQQNIQVVGATLRAIGYEIVPAASAEEATTRLAARLPDLILLDVRMPGTSGIAFCRQLRSDPLTAHIPVVFLSAADDSNLIVEALEAGGIDYITKPFNKAELLTRVRTHLSLKRARDDLSRVIAKQEEFIGVLAHDLLNPIGAISMSAQILLSGKVENPDTLRKLASTIEEASDRAARFIRSVLDDFAASHSGNALDPEATDVGALATEVVSLHQAAAGAKSITLEYEPPSGAVEALADRAALGRVLDNLISNAIKFSPPDTTVTISVEALAAGGAEVSVSDQGPGITEEDRPRLFGRFVRLSARPTGNEASTGLGLSVAHDLAQLMGGELRCDPDPGEGTRFVVSLAATEP
ncbi:hypothetical protein BH23VER1_BH23VER1_33920 [soil metagenome]